MASISQLFSCLAAFFMTPASRRISCVFCGAPIALVCVDRVGDVQPVSRSADDNGPRHSPRGDLRFRQRRHRRTPAGQIRSSRHGARGSPRLWDHPTRIRRLAWRYYGYAVETRAALVIPVPPRQPLQPIQRLQRGLGGELVGVDGGRGPPRRGRAGRRRDVRLGASGGEQRQVGEERLAVGRLGLALLEQGRGPRLPARSPPWAGRRACRPGCRKSGRRRRASPCAGRRSRRFHSRTSIVTLPTSASRPASAVSSW